MKPRRILNHRQLLQLLPKVVEGARVVIVRSFPGMPDGAKVDDDVTDAVVGLPTFNDNIKRGYLRVVVAQPTTTPAKTATRAAVVDRFAGLRAVTATAGKTQLRAALAAAGIVMPPEASRGDMFKAREKALGATIAPAPMPTPALASSEAPEAILDIDLRERELDEALADQDGDE